MSPFHASLRRRLGALMLALSGVAAGLAVSTLARAVELPARADLERLMGVAPQTITVVEPHMSTPTKPARVQYVGYPAQQVLPKLLGPNWNAPGMDLEFRALDGYVSRIPTERFARYQAWLVLARVGQAEFSVDNITQNEKRVALGPYYLIWDNVRSPELVPEGGSFWPYQVAQVLVSGARKAALLPASLPGNWGEHADLASKHCLACHQVNGFGGNKMPINLAQVVKPMSADSFTQWVIDPHRAKPGTTMPPLPEGLPLAERRAIAGKLLDYLKALPVQP